jgi:hypothetical protein
VQEYITNLGGMHAGPFFLPPPSLLLLLLLLLFDTYPRAVRA